MYFYGFITFTYLHTGIVMDENDKKLSNEIKKLSPEIKRKIKDEFEKLDTLKQDNDNRIYGIPNLNDNKKVKKIRNGFFIIILILFCLNLANYLTDYKYLLINITTSFFLIIEIVLIFYMKRIVDKM